jgi:hypothetical protein
MIAAGKSISLPSRQPPQIDGRSIPDLVPFLILLPIRFRECDSEVTYSHGSQEL